MSRIFLKRFWDAVVVVTATASALLVPVALIPGWHTHANIALIEWGITAVFAVDIIVRYRATHRSSRWGENQLLAVDIVAALPLYLLFGQPLLLLFRMFKLFRIAEFGREKLRTDIQRAAALRLSYFAYGLFLSAHWITSGWIALRGSAAAQEASWTAYINALYWCVTTLSTVGYGDVTPANNFQTLYAIVVMILGVGVYAYVIGNIATILTNIDPARSRYLQHIERLGAFIRYRQIPPRLQRRIHDYYDYLWEKRLGYDESHVLDSLPRSLRTDVSLFLKRDVIERVPLFADAPDQFKRDIAMQMTSEVFTPGDYILRAGEFGRDMFFISRGAVEVVSPDGKSVYSTLAEGDFFGEIALLEDQSRTASIRAVDYCDLYRLTRDVFTDVVAIHGDIADKIREKAAQRAQELRGSE